jgi:hypothetical protein
MAKVIHFEVGAQLLRTCRFGKCSQTIYRRLLAESKEITLCDRKVT